MYRSDNTLTQYNDGFFKVEYWKIQQQKHGTILENTKYIDIR
jgi:hypothetical protein